MTILQDIKNTCYYCNAWRCIDPNCGGIIDVAICSKRLIEVNEDTPKCALFERMTKEESAVRDCVRDKLVEVRSEIIREAKESYLKYDKVDLKEKVLDEILDVIKWEVMRKVEDE